MVKKFERRYCTDYRENRCNCGRDMAIFRFFKMAAATVLDFWNLKFLSVGRVMSVELCHRAKFCGTRSNSCRDIAVFDFSRWRPPPSWIFEMSNFYKYDASGVSNCVTKPNFVALSQTNRYRDIPIFGFVRWRNGREGRTASLCQILSK